MDGADDVFAEECLSAAMFAEHTADGLGLVEEVADFVDEGGLAAEVDGALAAVFTPGESEVGAETPAAVGAPSGGDRALGGEAEWVFAEEGEGWVVFWGDVHGQGVVIWRGSSIEGMNDWGCQGSGFRVQEGRVRNWVLVNKAVVLPVAEFGFRTEGSQGNEGAIGVGYRGEDSGVFWGVVVWRFVQVVRD